MDAEQEKQLMQLVKGEATVPHISEVTRVGRDETAGCRGLLAGVDLPGGTIVAREEIGVSAPSPSTPGISICWGLVQELVEGGEVHRGLLEDLQANPKLLAQTLLTPGDADMLRKLQSRSQRDPDYLQGVLSKVLANFMSVYRGERVGKKVRISVLAAIPDRYRMMNHSAERANIRVCSPVDDLYYCTIRDIQKGEPLLIDYGPDHAELL